MADDRGDEFASERGRGLVALRFGEVPFQDRLRRPLAEVGLEHRGEGESASGPPSSLPVSLQRHRR